WTEAKELTFADRADAGRHLLPLLGELRDQPGITVVGQPRGGVPVAAEVARALGAPLAVWVAQRIRAPHRPHLALGADGEDGDLAFHEDVLRKYGISPGYLVDEVRAQRAEAARRAQLYRRDDAMLELRGRHVVLV